MTLDKTKTKAILNDICKQVIICQVMILPNMQYFIPATGFHCIRIYSTWGKCNFYRVHCTEGTSSLGSAVVKLLCLAFRLCCLKYSVVLVRKIV